MHARTALWMVVTLAGAAGCAGTAASLDDTSNPRPVDGPAFVSTPASSAGDADEAAAPDGVGDRVLAPGELRLDDADWTKTWRRLAAPSISVRGASVAGARGGWVAVSSRDPDGTKHPPLPVSVVYRSQDGTHWHAVPIGTADEPLQNADVAYGNGRYVVLGFRGGSTVVLDSTDGETWREQALDPIGTFARGTVKYVHDHFFAMNISFWGSSDGEHWVQPEHAYPYALFADIAYGNGRYLGIGAGTQASTDGVEWRAAPIDCDLEGACIQDPGGVLLENDFGQAFFAEGHFHVTRTLSQDGEFRSADAKAWQYAAGPAPDAYVAGHFVKLVDAQPEVWLDESGAPEPLDVVNGPSTAPAVVLEPVPSDIDYSWGDALDCNNARCVVIRSALYLVP